MPATDHDEKYVTILHSVIDAGLTPQAFTIYAVLVKHANYNTREVFASRKTLAEHIGAKQPRSADRYVRELIDAGLILSVQERWTTQDRDRKDIVFERDDAHPVQTSNLYVISRTPGASPQVGPQCVSTHGGSALERTGGSALERTLTRTLKTNNHLNSSPVSVSASADRGHSSTGSNERTPLAETWEPNRTHRKVVEEKRLSLEWLVVDFRRRMEGEKRADWDKTFGAFILATIEGRVDTTFPVPADDVEVVDSTSPDPDRIAQDIARIARTGDLAAKPLTEDEREAAAWHLEQGHPWQEVAGYLEAWRENRPIVLGELGPSETDPWTGIYNSDWCREDARQYIVRDLRDRAIDPDSLTDRELDYVTAMLNNDEGPERAADWVKRNRSPIPA